MTGTEYVDNRLSSYSIAEAAKMQIKGWSCRELAKAYEAGKAEGTAQLSNAVMAAIRQFLPPLPDPRSKAHSNGGSK